MDSPATQTQISCPQCGKTLMVTEAHRGHHVRCPQCKSKLHVAADGLAAQLVNQTGSPPPRPTGANQAAYAAQAQPVPPTPRTATHPGPTGTMQPAGDTATAGRLNFGFFIGLLPRILQLYVRNALYLIGALIIMGLSVMVVGWIPFVGQIAALVVTAIMALGYAKFALNLVDGRKVEFGDLLAYKGEWLAATLAHLLVTIGLLVTYFAIFIAMAVVGGTIDYILNPSSSPSAIALLIVTPPFAIAAVFFMVAVMFWPFFVVDQGRKPFDAVVDSLKLAFRNCLGILNLVLLVFAVIFVFYGGVIAFSILGAQVMGGFALFLGFLAAVVFNFVAAPVKVLLLTTVFRHLVGPSKTPDLPGSELVAA